MNSSLEGPVVPDDDQLKDARRSGALAAREGFPIGVCPHPAGSTLAQVWAAAYADHADETEEA